MIHLLLPLTSSLDAATGHTHAGKRALSRARGGRGGCVAWLGRPNHTAEDAEEAAFCGPCVKERTEREKRERTRTEEGREGRGEKNPIYLTARQLQGEQAALERMHSSSKISGHAATFFFTLGEFLTGHPVGGLPARPMICSFFIGHGGREAARHPSTLFHSISEQRIHALNTNSFPKKREEATT